MEKIRLFALLMFSLTLMACSNTNKDLEEMIPDTASGVVCFNVPSMLEKAGIEDDDEIELPSQLKNVISQNEDSPISTILDLLPKSGIDMGVNVYAFFPKSTFSFVTLAAIDDEDALRKTVEQQTGEKFKDLEGISYLRSDVTSFAIKGKTLFVGREKHELEDTKLAIAAKLILSKQAKSIFDKKDIAECIKPESDISCYLEIQGLNYLMKEVPSLMKFADSCPLVSVLVDSDINAFTMNLMFDHDSAKINAAIKANKNSDFFTLLDATVSKPDDEFLKMMPISMNFVMALSLNGENCMKLDQVRKSVNLLSNLPSMDKLDFRNIVNSIDGPVAIGLSPSMIGGGSDSFYDNYNLALAAKVKDSKKIIEQVKAFAKEMGQEEYVKNDYYVYDYEGLPLLIGTKGNYVYIMRLDHELLEDFYYDYEDYRKLFANSSFGFFLRQDIDTVKTLINFSSNGKKEGEGVFLPLNDNQNTVVAFWTLMSSLSFSSNAESEEQNFDF